MVKGSAVCARRALDCRPCLRCAHAFACSRLHRPKGTAAGREIVGQRERLRRLSFWSAYASLPCWGGGALVSVK